MRHILVLRHAKAERESPADAGDFGRALSPRGRRQLTELPELLACCERPPQLIVASSSDRTRETAEGIVAAFPTWRCRVFLDEALYLGTAEVLLARLASLPDLLRSVCIVGHNPGVTELVERLTGRSVLMPPMGIAMITSDASQWADLEGAGARVEWSAVPKK